MTQTYSHPTAIARMRQGLCPECGISPERHTNDSRFWIPRPLDCDLLQEGVTARIAKQREIDEGTKQADE